jgi:hypothetical protein
MSRNSDKYTRVVVLVISLGVGLSLCAFWVSKSLPFFLARTESRTSWYGDRPGEIEGLVDALLQGRHYDAVFSLRQLKIRSEVLGISKEEYIALLNEVIDRVRASDQNIEMPEELIRAEDGTVRYGLFSGTSPLPAQEADAERAMFVREVAMLREAGHEESAAFLEDVTLWSLVASGSISEEYRTKFKRDVAWLVESRNE